MPLGVLDRPGAEEGREEEGQREGEGQTREGGGRATRGGRVSGFGAALKQPWMGTGC